MNYLPIIIPVIAWILAGLYGQKMWSDYLNFRYSHPDNNRPYKAPINRWINAAIVGPFSILLVLLEVYRYHSTHLD